MRKSFALIGRYKGLEIINKNTITITIYGYKDNNTYKVLLNEDLFKNAFKTINENDLIGIKGYKSQCDKKKALICEEISVVQKKDRNKSYLML